jgi:hypothetical protein
VLILVLLLRAARFHRFWSPKKILFADYYAADPDQRQLQQNMTMTLMTMMMTVNIRPASHFRMLSADPGTETLSNA